MTAYYHACIVFPPRRAGLLDFEDGRRGALAPFNQRLNQSQLDAITFALNGPSRISLIHGPPVSCRLPSFLCCLCLLFVPAATPPAPAVL